MLLGFPLGMLLSSKGQSGSYRILYFILDCAKQQSVSSGVTEHSAQHGSAAAGPLEWVPPRNEDSAVPPGGHTMHEEALGAERFSELFVHAFNPHFCRGTSRGPGPGQSRLDTALLGCHKRPCDKGASCPEVASMAVPAGGWV